MPRLTAANSPVLANVKRFYNAPIYAKCLDAANGPDGIPGVFACLSRIMRRVETEESLASAVASLPTRAAEALREGKRLPVGAKRAG